MPCFCLWSGQTVHLLSFPTRRSSDLLGRRWCAGQCLDGHRRQREDIGRERGGTSGHQLRCSVSGGQLLSLPHPVGAEDRKSTRLNSSHVKISYAVFCLKKEKYSGRRE